MILTNVTGNFNTYLNNNNILVQKLAYLIKEIVDGSTVKTSIKIPL